MNYNNDNIRRRDRLLDKPLAEQLLRNGEYGVLSMCDGSSAYGIPVNYVWDGKDSIYIHCAPQGRKLDILALNSSVSFCIIGCTHVLPDSLTTRYESIIVKGSATAELSAEERMNALEMILDKYSPDHKTVGMKYAEKSFHRTAVIRNDDAASNLIRCGEPPEVRI